MARRSPPPRRPSHLVLTPTVRARPQPVAQPDPEAAARPVNYFAPCTLGLEQALVSELTALGAQQIEVRPGGASFRGDRRLGYAANLWLRSAIRVQEQLLLAPAVGRDELYEAVARLNWQSYLGVDQTLAIDASVRDSAITHSNFAALTAKDAIVDQFRAALGRRPSVDTEQPDLPLKLLLQRDVLTLYRNLSGTSLHKRGWRPVQVKSPLNEATAAGLLILSGWDRASPLVDPMCGSGTFLIEAACLAADRAPGLQRRFAFERWPDFDGVLWQELRAEAGQRARLSLPFNLEGADLHAGAIAIAEKCAAAAGVDGLLRLRVAGAAEWQPSSVPAVVVCNPPWGERLGEGEDLLQSWRDLGRFLHERCAGARAYVLCGNAELTRHLGLRAERRWPVMNGPIECRLLEYELHAAR
ncbi:MAG: THUMP domain-containing class I SAM-dependent RNA methyltransferase [Planctomycetota bacterium]